MTQEEFHARHAGEKPYFEYWNGEAVQKPVATLLHVLIQKILQVLLDGIGYSSLVELEIRLDPEYEPPDQTEIIAARGDRKILASALWEEVDRSLA